MEDEKLFVIGEDALEVIKETSLFLYKPNRTEEEHTLALKLRNVYREAVEIEGLTGTVKPQAC